MYQIFVPILQTKGKEYRFEFSRRVKMLKYREIWKVGSLDQNDELNEIMVKINESSEKSYIDCNANKAAISGEKQSAHQSSMGNSV